MGTPVAIRRAVRADSVSLRGLVRHLPGHGAHVQGDRLGRLPAAGGVGLGRGLVGQRHASGLRPPASCPDQPLLNLHDSEGGCELVHIGRVRGYDDITARCGDQRDLPIDHIGRARRRQ